MPSDTPVASMTGFARVEGRVEGYGWTFEVKSVNGRNLDVRCRVPAGFDALDIYARAAVPRHVNRGTVSVSLNLTRREAAGHLRINRALLDQVLAVARELEGAGASPPRLDALLAVRGVIETAEEAESSDGRIALDAALAAGLGQALEGLASARRAEGARLAATLGEQLDEIERLTAAASERAMAQPALLRERLLSQVAELVAAVPALSQDRLAQETALLVTRTDVREEIDRLRAHAAAARGLLTEGGVIGRRLDFLCQEFNREANTLCSKSADLELTRIGLALKVTIDQFREQAQNVE